jgi:hypothetical protein
MKETNNKGKIMNNTQTKNSFPVRKITRSNGGVIEIRTYSMHWGLIVRSPKGEIVSSHSGNKKNNTWKKELIARYK